MTETIIPTWLSWAREIQALAQTGLHYSENEFDRERYERLLEISAEMIGNNSQLDRKELANVYARQKGYATPRIDVRGAVFKDGKLLMVQERMDGGWTMPGGWADVGDMPSIAVEREILEEAGFCVNTKRVIGVYDANRTGPMEIFHAYKILFECEIVAGEARVSNETTDVGFFDRYNLPTPLSGERTKPRQIMDAFKAHRFKDWQTIFD